MTQAGLVKSLATGGWYLNLQTSPSLEAGRWGRKSQSSNPTWLFPKISLYLEVTKGLISMQKDTSQWEDSKDFRSCLGGKERATYIFQTPQNYTLLQARWSSTLSIERAINLTFFLANSGASFAALPSSVVHTGVKSRGWEKRMPHLKGRRGHWVKCHQHCAEREATASGLKPGSSFLSFLKECYEDICF